MNPSPIAAWAALLPGQHLGRFHLGQLVGSGFFSAVFEARDTLSGDLVAVKVLPPISSATDTLEFQTEGQLLRGLVGSSAIVTLLESSVATLTMTLAGGVSVPVQVHYHALELADGSLDELVADPGTRNALSWDEKIRAWRSVVLGIHQMHLRRQAHRDLKCSNVLLFLSGKSTTAKIGDLGRSRDLTVAARLPAEEYVIGRGDLTVAAPECLWWQGDDDELSFRGQDLYALGSILTELTSGQPMSAIAFGDIRQMLEDGRADYMAGVHSDLAVLRPSIRNAVSLIAPAVPAEIRFELCQTVRQLCDPVPLLRFPRHLGRPQLAADLGWLLRRADILSKRLSSGRRQRRRLSSGSVAGRSAS